MVVTHDVGESEEVNFNSAVSVCAVQKGRRSFSDDITSGRLVITLKVRVRSTALSSAEGREEGSRALDTLSECPTATERRNFTVLAHRLPNQFRITQTSSL